MDRPLLLFAPGAGAPSTSPWMAAWSARLEALGRVVRFDYPYTLDGRRTPDRLPVLIDAHARALAAARRSDPVVLVGKSMGSRVGCHLALREAVRGLVCLGYPLRAASGALRDRVLLELRTPILFVQGTRDRLCPLEELEAVRARMQAPTALHLVEGGDHSLQVGVRDLRATGRTQVQGDEAALGAIGAFLHELP
jgi:predicted alpha/beta-hydrolase family hydrolase